MTMSREDPLFETVFEDHRVLVINKPAGLVCHPTKGDERSSLVGRVRLHLGAGVRSHLINRLDRETSGLVVVAKDDETAACLRADWEGGRVQKVYQAVVRGWPELDSSRVDQPIGKDESSPVAIKGCVLPGRGASSVTGFTVRRRFERPEGRFAELEARPLSGRKHQIRIHLAHSGHPIVGDKLYGGDERAYLDFVEGRLSSDQARSLLTPFHCLHAASLDLVLAGAARRFVAEPEPWFVDFLAGKAPDWDVINALTGHRTEGGGGKPIWRDGSASPTEKSRLEDE